MKKTILYFISSSEEVIHPSIKPICLSQDFKVQSLPALEVVVKAQRGELAWRNACTQGHFQVMHAAWHRNGKCDILETTCSLPLPLPLIFLEPFSSISLSHSGSLCPHCYQWKHLPNHNQLQAHCTHIHKHTHTHLCRTGEADSQTQSISVAPFCVHIFWYNKTSERGYLFYSIRMTKKQTICAIYNSLVVREDLLVTLSFFAFYLLVNLPQGKTFKNKKLPPPSSDSTETTRVTHHHCLAASISHLTHSTPCWFELLEHSKYNCIALQQHHILYDT